MKVLLKSMLPVLSLLSLLALLAPLPAAAKTLDTPEKLLAYLASHRSDISLVSYTVAPDGSVDPSGPEILVNPDRLMPLASTFKIVVLAAYAREVAAGRLDPEEPVSLTEWERNYLPGTDGGAHAAALDGLGIPADRYGFARDSTRSVPLDAVAHAMIKFSDNTATDFLMEILGPERMRETLDAAGLRKQEMPLPIIGVFLAWANHEDGPLTPGRMRALLRLDRNDYLARVQQLTDRFHNETWRTLEYHFLLTANPEPAPRVEAKVADKLFIRGTAREYAQIQAGVMTGTFLSPEISAVMRRHLGWATELPGIGSLFSAAGFKGGSLYGVLTGAWYLVPSTGDFAGQKRVSVLFLRRMPIWAWNEVSESLSDIQLELLLGLDRSFAEAVRQTLSQQ